ncbi:hypothetical protein ACOZ3Q_000591 [Cronobacter sakazakii]
MAYVKKGYLKETVQYVSNSGINYKYEIFQRSDGSSFYAVVSRLDEAIPGSGHYIWIYDGNEINFPDGTNHFQFAVDEVTDHFKFNFQDS